MSFHNISYTDPNQNIKAPILRITSSLREGEITEEEANDKYLKVLTDTLFESVKPFASESVLNSATANFIVALYDGRRAGGNAVKDVIEGENAIERFPDAFTNFMFDIGPGLLKEGYNDEGYIGNRIFGVEMNFKTIQQYLVCCGTSVDNKLKL